MRTRAEAGEVRVQVLGNRTLREQTLGGALPTSIERLTRSAFCVVSVPPIEPLPWSTIWIAASTPPHRAVTEVLPIVAGRLADLSTRSGDRERPGAVGIGDDHELEALVTGIGESGGRIGGRTHQRCR